MKSRLKSEPGPAQIVDVQLAAYNARDLPAFIATYAHDVCIYDMPHAIPVLVGRDAVAEHYGNTTFRHTDLHAEILARTVAGNKVADHERTWGLEAEPIETLVVYEVHGGLIRGVWFFEVDTVSPLPDEDRLLTN